MKFVRNKKVKDKETVTKPADGRIEESLFGEAEGYKLRQICPCHRSAIQECEKKER